MEEGSDRQTVLPSRVRADASRGVSRRRARRFTPMATDPDPDAEAPPSAQPAAPDAPAEAAPPPPTTWRARGRARRRLRYLRAARELALRDLGGLGFEPHPHNPERPDLLTGKPDAPGEPGPRRRL